MFAGQAAAIHSCSHGPIRYVAFTAAIVRTSRSIRRAATNLIACFTRKASINLAITIGLPPFAKLAIDYKADLSKPENRLPKPANDNKPRRSRKCTG